MTIVTNTCTTNTTVTTKGATPMNTINTVHTIVGKMSISDKIEYIMKDKSVISVMWNKEVSHISNGIRFDAFNVLQHHRPSYDIKNKNAMCLNYLWELIDVEAFTVDEEYDLIMNIISDYTEHADGWVDLEVMEDRACGGISHDWLNNNTGEKEFMEFLTMLRTDSYNMNFNDYFYPVIDHTEVVPF